MHLPEYDVDAPSTPFVLLLRAAEEDLVPRPADCVRTGRSLLGIAGLVSVVLAIALLAKTDLSPTSLAHRRRPFRPLWSAKETAEGKLLVLDGTRFFTYAAALSGLVSIAASTFSILAPPAGTANATLAGLLDLCVLLIGTGTMLAGAQSVWHRSDKVQLGQTVPGRLSKVALNKRCCSGVGVLAASVLLVTVVRALAARHFDQAFMELRDRVHDLVAQNVEATPARMFLLAGVLGRIRSAGNRWRWAVVASQSVGIVVGIAVLRVAVRTTRRHRRASSPGDASPEAPIELPVTPPATEPKSGFAAEMSRMDIGEDPYGEDMFHLAKAKDDLVVICTLVGIVATVSMVASVLGLVVASVPALYWGHVTLRRVADLVAPLASVLAQVAALAALLVEVFRTRSTHAISGGSRSLRASASGHLPLSTRVVNLSARYRRRRGRANSSQLLRPSRSGIGAASSESEMRALTERSRSPSVESESSTSSQGSEAGGSGAAGAPAVSEVDGSWGPRRRASDELV